MGEGIAVDSGHIYWTIPATPTNPGSIARANLDGTNVDPSFIPGPESLAGIAVDAGHVYWTNFFPGAVGRADLGGTNVDEGLITGDTGKEGVAVDADHIYWGNFATDTIGRADLDGTNVDENFIPAPYVGSVAVDSGHVYWTKNVAAGVIGRADLDGTNVDENFITGVSADALAVDGLTIKDTTVAAAAKARRVQRQTGHKIQVKLKIKAKEALSAQVTGKILLNPSYRLKPKTVQLAAGQTKALKLRPKRKRAEHEIVKALERGRATAKLRLELSDEAGNVDSEKLNVKLSG